MADRPQMDKDKLMQIMQQKVGNLELTLNALISVLEEKDIVDEDNIRDRAQEIIKEAQERQQEMQEGSE